jgi:Uma2 family endonuclease
MPLVLEQPETRAVNAISWTREDCERMEEVGLLPERWELIQGEVISKMGQGLQHSFVIQRIQLWLVALFGYSFVAPQVTINVAPIDEPTSAPVPDIVVLNTPALRIAGSPKPNQMVLVIEVADTTLSFDLGVKARLYARAGIPEYWVASVKGRKLWVLRDPVDGKYSDIAELNEQAEVSPLGRSETIRVGEFFS